MVLPTEDILIKGRREWGIFFVMAILNEDSLEKYLKNILKTIKNHQKLIENGSKNVEKKSKGLSKLRKKMKKNAMKEKTWIKNEQRFLLLIIGSKRGVTHRRAKAPSRGPF